MTLTKRRLFLLLLAGLGFAVGIGLLVDAFRKPPVAVNGRTLTEWLADLDASDEKNRIAAEQAVTLAGTNAVQTLRGILNRKDPLLLSAYRKIGPQLPRWAQRQLHLLIKPADFDMHRKHAAQALGLIGPAAAPAIPDLINALADRGPMVCLAAVHALSRMGKDALPPLAQALKTAPQDARLHILSILAEHGTETELPLPDLLNLLATSGSDTEITATIHVLRKLDLKSLQPLFAMLGSPDSKTRDRAKRAFASVAGANPSMPFKLAELYPDQPLPVRSAMADVLEQSSVPRHLTGVFMLKVAADTDPRLQQRGTEWLRQHLSLDELDRLLKTVPEPVRHQIRASYSQSSEPGARDH
ncbi:MAG: HEAT repeat domain-containing protein [Verrucomicrobiota bacterium]|nr:HEAT repeat domain-containing protein [Verrucomicrobiota bacterium]